MRLKLFLKKARVRRLTAEPSAPVSLWVDLGGRVVSCFAVVLSDRTLLTVGLVGREPVPAQLREEIELLKRLLRD